MKLTPPCIIVGIDASIAGMGLAALLIASRNRFGLIEAHRTTTASDTPQPQRLGIIRDALNGFLKELKSMPLLKDKLYPVHVVIEDFAFNAKFGRELSGMVQGVLIEGVWRVHKKTVHRVSIRESKKVACPDWPGWSKDHWARSGRKTKYRHSMPDKNSIMVGLYKRYGINLFDDAEADATCAALRFAVEKRLLPSTPIQQSEI